MRASELDGGVRRDEPSSRDRALGLFVHLVAPLPFHVLVSLAESHGTFLPITVDWLSLPAGGRGRSAQYMAVPALVSNKHPHNSYLHKTLLVESRWRRGQTRVEAGERPCGVSPLSPRESRPSQEGDATPHPQRTLEDMSSVSSSAQSCRFQRSPGN